MTRPNYFPAELLTRAFEWIIVHCSATSPQMDIGAEWIDRLHRRMGWSRCGYHIVIRRDGTVEMHHLGHRARPLGMHGSHVGGCGPGWNDICLGICLIGGVKGDGRTPDDNFTAEQYRSLAHAITQASAAYEIDSTQVIGHRDLIKMTNASPKACPCFSVREWMQTIKPEFRDNEPPVTIMDSLFDAIRMNFNWDKNERPGPKKGDKLALPRTHTVKAGETLWGISRVTGVPVHKLQSLNGLNSSLIKRGQKLRLLD